jgi:hypothetical protein
MVISADFEKQKQYFIKKNIAFVKKNMVLLPYLFMVICFYRNMARKNRSCAKSLYVITLLQESILFIYFIYFIFKKDQIRQNLF